jgi:hypothetical protein
MLTFLIQVFLKINQHKMLMGFCLIELKNIAVLFSVYSLLFLSVINVKCFACYCYIRVKWIVMDEFEEIFQLKNVRWWWRSSNEFLR